MQAAQWEAGMPDRSRVSRGSSRAIHNGVKQRTAVMGGLYSLLPSCFSLYTALSMEAHHCDQGCG